MVEETKICENCQQVFPVIDPKYGNRRKRFCSHKCYHAFHRGANHACWKGGKFLCPSKGYIRVNVGSNKTQSEHVLIAEKVLGRRLKKGECVHHINGDKTDNRNSNLLICTVPYHLELHARMSKLYQEEHFDPKPVEAI